MNLFVYILSIYMLALAVFPCCAVDDCADDTAKPEQIAGHEKGDADCGSCSPFFSCEGCAAASVTMETTSSELEPLTIKQVYAGFIPSIISGIQYDFWQPPKLG